MKEADSLAPSLAKWYRTDFIAGKANSLRIQTPLKTIGKLPHFKHGTLLAELVL